MWGVTIARMKRQKAKSKNYMPYTPIVATLGYMLDRSTQRVLMIHRNIRIGDHHLGKYNGLGGKLEPREDIVSGMKREIQEEAGVEVTALRLRGSINWPGFGKHGEDWLGFIFVIDGWRGEPLTENNEGTLHWIDLDRILQSCAIDEKTRLGAALPMWPGDMYFLPLVFGDDTRQFHGVMPYENGAPTGWQYEWV